MTQQTNTNPATHGDVLGLVNDNANDAEGRLSTIEGAAIMEGVLETFYFDWATGAIMAEGDTTSPSGMIGLTTRSVIPITTITTPLGDTLDNYTIISAEAEGFIDKAYVIDNEGWHTLNMWDNFGDFDQHRGSFSGVYKNMLVVQTLYSDVLHIRTKYFPHLAGQSNYSETTGTIEMHCRFKVMAVKKSVVL
jgi:hypothetical protein